MTSIQEYALIVNIVLSLAIAWLSFREPKRPGTRSLVALSVIVALWSLAYLLYSYQLFRFPKSILISIAYFASAMAAAMLLRFSLTYSNRGKLITWVTLLLFTIQPVVTQVLFWVESWRKTFFFEAGPFAALQLSPHSGLWADVHTIYLYNLEIASVLLLTDIFMKKPRTLLWQSGTLLAGAFAPVIFRLRNVVGVPGEFFDYSLLGYGMALVGLAHGIYRESLVETIPVTSDAVIEGTSDGVMVLDLSNNIIEVNPAAERIVGLSRQNLYGKSVRSVLPDWFDLSNAIQDGKELEMRRSIRSQDNWRYLNVRLSSLRDKNGEPFGQLVVWRDITERKLAEDARQRARDEMFALLNAIYNAASNSMSLNDFLSESIYQIITPFDSQVVAICLADEDENRSGAQSLHLVAHFGLTSKTAATLNTVPIAGAFLEGLFKSKQPVAIHDVPADTDVPEHLKLDDVVSSVVLPLFTQTGVDSKILGAICLGRKEAKPYTQDEIIRLSAIAEQIASLIDSDRRRQLAIALSERERLLRDLHDSVSQKLYGLVTLTEAAQAGLEAGSKVVPSQVLAKIGENARQAVKEMRLFLYEMQPVDLEEEGLITVLHHRLAAVEGRADIQARLLADEDISLTKDKEVAFYYIAQEALNNVLKHAHAHSVLVTLKQTRQSVILEIVDDGRGFEMKKVDRGGMGLQNMKVRTSQIDGKLKITSQPGSGTKVQVKVNRDRTPVQIRNR
jgi:PAS domain S-box-containing protein